MCGWWQRSTVCVCEGSWPVISCGDVGGGGSRDKTGGSGGIRVVQLPSCPEKPWLV